MNGFSSKKKKDSITKCFDLFSSSQNIEFFSSISISFSSLFTIRHSSRFLLRLKRQRINFLLFLDTTTALFSFENVWANSSDNQALLSLSLSRHSAHSLLIGIRNHDACIFIQFHYVNVRRILWEPCGHASIDRCGIPLAQELQKSHRWIITFIDCSQLRCRCKTIMWRNEST
jgi:hypothetical protein